MRIGSVTGPALDLVLPVIRDMRVTYPDIAFSVQVDTPDRLAEALSAAARRVIDAIEDRISHANQ